MIFEDIKCVRAKPKYRQRSGNTQTLDGDALPFGRERTSRNITTVNPADLIQKHRSGLSTIVSKADLNKRLSTRSAKPSNNVLLKRNPLIIEKTNFQNNQQFAEET